MKSLITENHAAVFISCLSWRQPILDFISLLMVLYSRRLDGQSESKMTEKICPGLSLSIIEDKEVQ
jgi:hypothetical protein